MTPTGSRLQLQLDNEYQRMVNEWFFKWHQIKGGFPVEIDSFGGRPIRYSYVAFEGSPHRVYWDTIQHYLRQKVSDVFDKLEREIRDYPTDVRRDALKEARYIVSGFAAKIRQQAKEKDRILRGDGVNFPEARDFGTWEGSTSADIEQRANALVKIYASGPILKVDSSQSWVKSTYEKHHWWLYLVLTVVGVVAAILALF